MNRIALLSTFGLASLVARAQDVAFLAAPIYECGMAPYSIRLADMDGDGDLDAVTVEIADQETGTVSIGWNDGRGRFSPGPRIDVGPGAQWLEVGDLNGDQRPDVLVSNGTAQDSKSVAILMNTGGALSLTGHIAETGNAQPEGIEIGDFTGDGKPDVAVAYLWLGDVRVYAGNGAGQFTRYAAKFPGMTPRDLATADFNRDNKLDFVVCSVNSAQVYFGTGTDFVKGPYMDNFHQGEADHVVAGDFDNDGDDDFVTTGQKLTLFRNEGLGQVWSKTHTWTGENAVGLTKADFDGDGNLDVAASVYLGNAVSIYYGDGQGTFTVRKDWGVGLAPNDLHCGDVNGDGTVDIAAVSSQLSQTDFQVLLNVGDRAYLGRRDYDVVGNANGFAVADFDKDGKSDVAVAVYESNTDSVRVARGNGDGTLQDAVRIENIGNNLPTNVIAADFNADGWMDIAASIFSPGNRMRVWINDKAGSFPPSASYAAGGNPSSLAAADLNGDRILDVVVVNAAQTDNSISVFRGFGDGTFAAGVRIPTLFRPNDVAIADWDRDGDMDPLVTHSGATAVLVFVNDGQGNFSTKTVNLGVTQGTPTAVDLDADGWMDVAVTTGRISALMNDRAGGFVLAQTGTNAGAVGVADWDRDGDADLVGTEGFVSRATVLLNNGAAQFIVGPVLRTGFETGRCGGADLGYDGLPEILTANNRAGSVSVLQNTTWTVAETFSVFRGILESGGVAQTRHSDDDRATVKSGLVLNQQESPVTLRFLNKSPSLTPASLRVIVEAKTSTVGLTQRIDLYDWALGAWVEVDSRASALADQWTEVAVASPDRFVKPGNGAIWAQVRYKASGPVQTMAWSASVDFFATKVRE